MITIEFPPPDFRIMKTDGKELIFDRFRKRFVKLTPEEWVRQNFLNYLVSRRQYPATLIGIEKEIFLGEMKKRYDIVVYDRDTRPWMIIECKEMNVPLTQSVLEQVVRYHMVVPAVFLVITNGVNTFCCRHHGVGTQWEFIPELPAWGE